MNFFNFLYIFGSFQVLLVQALNSSFIFDFTQNFINSQHIVLFGCQHKDLLETTKLLINSNRRAAAIHAINIEQKFSSVTKILSRQIYAQTSVILDCTCNRYKNILQESSMYKYFNNSYQWLIVDENNAGVLVILKDFLNIGLNTQMIFVNQTENQEYFLYDIYSIGRHLKQPLVIRFLAKWKGQFEVNQELENVQELQVHQKSTNINVMKIQSIQFRSQFNGLQLRGAVVVDRDNITENSQLNDLLCSECKVDGVTLFTTYHYAMVGILQQYFNFTIDYRVTRGWADRLPNSTYRLGLLGVMNRNEADISASPSFTRLNRFAEFDFIHQAWLFEVAVIYVYTSKLQSGNGSSGNFLAPFDLPVWITSLVFIFIIAIVWKLFEIFAKRFHIEKDKQISFDYVAVQSVAAICQQGLEPPPKTTTGRIIVLTLVLLSFVLYNYYTSSVVGGLLSFNNQGPKNLDELVDSDLALSFEDVPYNKVLFKEQIARPIVNKIYTKKMHPKRDPHDLTQFASIKNAIPYVKRGSHGFQCELVAVFDDISKQFNPEEICLLRIIGGLFPVQVMSMILPKRSQYSEAFKIILVKAREVGISKRELLKTRAKRPKCEGALTIEPVSLQFVRYSYILLGVGMVMSLMILGCEMFYRSKKDSKTQKTRLQFRKQ